jgi:hypothetical protein
MVLTEGFLFTGWALKWKKKLINCAYVISGFHDNEYWYLFYWQATPNNLLHQYKRLQDHAVSISKTAPSVHTVTLSGRLHHQTATHQFAPPLRMQQLTLKGL